MGENLLYFEDLEVGQEFHSDSYELTEDEIIEFAGKYDPQTFHTDPIAAKETFFGGLAASGWHTAAVSMRLQILSEPHFAGGSIGLGVEISWPQPTRAGDILTVFSTIIELKTLKSQPERGMVAINSKTKNQKGEILQNLVSRVIILRKVALTQNLGK